MRFGQFFEKRREKEKRLELEAEERRMLLEKEREVEKLTSDVAWFKRLMAHNVRMPFAVILGYGEMLEEDGFATREEELECIRKICRNIEYLDTLFQVLLDCEDEGLLEKKEHFDVLGCVREVTEYVRMIVQKAGIKIRINSSRNQILLYGNKVSLMRAFFNLIENSVRYMEQQGNIVITIEETETEILIVYRDEGKGMKQEEADRITEFTYQGSNGRADGSGIGMYLIRQSVEQQGGTLTVKTGEGNGMRVDMSFAKNRQQNL